MYCSGEKHKSYPCPRKGEAGPLIKDKTDACINEWASQIDELSAERLDCPTYREVIFAFEGLVRMTKVKFNYVHLPRGFYGGVRIGRCLSMHVLITKTVHRTAHRFFSDDLELGWLAPDMDRYIAGYNITQALREELLS